MKKMFMLLLFLCFFSNAAQNTYACSCSARSMNMKLQLSLGGQLSAENKVWFEQYSGIVFNGQVTKIKRVKVKYYGDATSEYQVTFKVDRYWRGSVGSEVVVYTGVGNGDCGFGFRKGEGYIVFAEMLDNRLKTGGCSLTAGAKYEANILKGLELGEGEEPLKPSITTKPAKSPKPDRK